MGHPQVKCVVNTCTHWLTGDLCGARNIDIIYEEEYKVAENPEHTQCKTFEQRRGLANTLGSMDNVNWGGVLAHTLLPGSETSPSVTCTVHSCRYWQEVNRCTAERIDVVGMSADESQDTNCCTFQLKG